MTEQEQAERSGQPESPPSLVAIAAVFTRYANLTWGGGSATIAVLHDQVIARRKWISELQFSLAFALSRLTPGTNLLAFCTAAGWLVRGWPGAIVALIASSLPCSALVLLVTHFYEVVQHNAIVVASLRGAFGAAVAIMFYTAWHLASGHIKAEPLRAAIVVPAAALLATFGALTPVKILLLAAGAGVLWPAEDEKEVAK